MSELLIFIWNDLFKANFARYNLCDGVVYVLYTHHYSDNCQVFQREVLRSRRNSTTVVNRPNMVLNEFTMHT